MVTGHHGVLVDTLDDVVNPHLKGKFDVQIVKIDNDDKENVKFLIPAAVAQKHYQRVDAAEGQTFKYFHLRVENSHQIPLIYANGTHIVESMI